MTVERRGDVQISLLRRIASAVTFFGFTRVQVPRNNWHLDQFDACRCRYQVSHLVRVVFRLTR